MYEGVPNFPGNDRFWEIVEKYGVTIFYTAPTAIRTIMKWGDEEPREARPVEPAHPRLGRRADQPRGVDVVPHLHRRRAVPDRRHVVADRDRRDHDQPAARRHDHQAGLGDVPAARASAPRSIDDNAEHVDGRRRLPDPDPAVAVDAARHLGRPRALPGDVLEPVPRPLLRRRRRQARRRRLPLAARPRRRRDERVRATASRRPRSSRRWSRTPTSPRPRWSGPTTPPPARRSSPTSRCAAATTSTPRTLRDHVGVEIGAIAKPKTIYFTPELPKTRSGKIMRRLLRDVAEGRNLGDTTTLADAVGRRRAQEEGRRSPVGGLTLRPGPSVNSLVRAAEPVAAPCKELPARPSGPRSADLLRAPGAAGAGAAAAEPVAEVEQHAEGDEDPAERRHAARWGRRRSRRTASCRGGTRSRPAAAGSRRTPGRRGW